MTKTELRRHLITTMLFTSDEIAKILHTAGTYTTGNAIIACEILGIELTDNDIDILYG